LEFQQIQRQPWNHLLRKRCSRPLSLQEVARSGHLIWTLRVHLARDSIGISSRSINRSDKGELEYRYFDDCALIPGHLFVVGASCWTLKLACENYDGARMLRCGTHRFKTKDCPRTHPPCLTCSYSPVDPASQIENATKTEKTHPPLPLRTG
jgi:hypothetical protein